MLMDVGGEGPCEGHLSRGRPLADPATRQPEAKTAIFAQKWPFSAQKSAKSLRGGTAPAPPAARRGRHLNIDAICCALAA